MSRWKAAFLFMVILSAVSGCKESARDTADYRPGLVLETSKDFLIPRSLKKQIETEYLAFIRKENPKVVLPDAEILARIPREFLDVEVYFRGSAPGVLSGDTVFRLPRGGGSLDLKDYVVGERGSFFMKFVMRRSNEPEKKLSDPHVYFLSEVKRRRIDGEDFGAGCGRFMEITSQILKANDGGGFQLNATENRYYPVIGGTFYFVDFDPERRMFLAAVRIEDSRFPNESCPVEAR